MTPHKLHNGVERGAAALSDREERLLAQYFDSECSWLGRWRVGRMLRSRPEARQFMDSLALGRVSLSQLANPQTESVDLWTRISNRIDAEKHAEIFLGKRAASDNLPADGQSSFRPGFLMPGFLKNRFPKSIKSEHMKWGFSGALATACLMALVVGMDNQNLSGSSPGLQTATLLPSNAVLPSKDVKISQLRLAELGTNEQRNNERGINEQGLSRVTASQSEFGPDSRQLSMPERSRDLEMRTLERPRIINERIPSAVEVDWMRSDGRLKIMQDPNDTSAIIWVRKRPRQQDRYVQGYPGE